MCENKVHKKRLQILMSTYNGESYLRNQIESYFLMNRFEECCVLIRDDGSTDGTRMILQEYERYPQFQIIHGENIGITASYQWLLTHSDPECEYFAFSDQDDIWMQFKVDVAMNQLDELPKNEKLLFASVSRLIDAQGNGIGFSQKPERGLSYYNAMIQNVLSGHTQVFNRTLRDFLAASDFQGVELIDWWLYLVASSMGRIVYYPEYTVLHRQHGRNAVGYSANMIRDLHRKWENFRKKDSSPIAQQLALFFRQYIHELPEEYRNETCAFLSGTATIGRRIHYLFHRRVYRQNKIDDLQFVISYLIGRYKF